MHAETFHHAGDVTLPAMVYAAALQAIDAALTGTTAPPSQMLALPWCAALAENLCGQLVACCNSCMARLNCHSAWYGLDPTWNKRAPHSVR